jgi:hypothetical protein
MAPAPASSTLQVPALPPDTPHILLVNPWIHDFAAYDAWASPLGLLTLAAILRHHGYRVSYIDCLNRFHPRSPRQDPSARFGCGPFRKTRIPKPKLFSDVPRHFSRYGIDPAWFREDARRLPPPDLILVTSAMTYWYTGVNETISALRHAFPKTPLVLGGIYASLCSAHARRHSGADVVFSGPAEGAILELAGSCTGFSTRRRFDPHAPDTYPRPAFDLQHRIAYVAFLTGRGCPFACAYCASHLLQPERVHRSPESTAGELAYWHRRQAVTDFVLYDDAFLADVEGHALPTLEAIVRRNLRIRLHTPNALHIRGVSAPTAELLFKAGFTTVRLGLETADFEHRGGLDRKVTAADFARAVAHLRAAGFESRQVGVYLLAGLPGQRTQSIVDSIDAVKDAGATPILAYYSPIPGTGLWEQATAASRYDLSSDPLFTNNAALPCRPGPFDWGWLAALKQRAAAGKPPSAQRGPHPGGSTTRRRPAALPAH